MYLFKDNVYLKKLINCFTVWHLFTMDRKVDTWFRTHIHWITIVVLPWILFSSLNINWKYFKSIPPNIGSDQEEQFWCLNIDRVALFYTMKCPYMQYENVRYDSCCYAINLRNFWFTVDMVFALKFFIGLMCVWLKKVQYSIFVHINESNLLFSFCP